MRGEVGKETPKKEMVNRRIFMTSHMTLSAVSGRPLNDGMHGNKKRTQVQCAYRYVNLYN